MAEGKRKSGCIVQRGTCIKREPLATGEPWGGLVVVAGSSVWISDGCMSSARLVEPSLPYHWVDTPWGRGVHVHGEGLELPA